MVKNTDFAVVDVETTGLFPKAGDRVIEIGALRIAPTGKVVDEYATLVNPHRDVGATHVHGITARDVSKAPRFEEIAGDVVSLLAGAVFVAHNVSFDLRFVRAELARMGSALPDCPRLCTMQLARKADPAIPSRRLGELCNHFGINLGHAHSAYHDALATAELFAVCLSKLGGWSHLSLSGIGVKGTPLGRDHWPSIPPSGRLYRRERAAKDFSNAPSFIARLVAKLPAASRSEPALEAYLALLDRVLEDRRVDDGEFRELHALATDLGMSRQQATQAHHAYLRDLIHVALDDDVITEAERKDLDEVRRLLSISSGQYAALLGEVRRERASGSGRPRASSVKPPDIEGKSICFTGALNCLIDAESATRSLAQTIAAGHGMEVRKGVTKTLDFLVASDPDSMSGKAKKARQYGVRIIAEPVFWRMMGIEIE